jgi:hypothetical protein
MKRINLYTIVVHNKQDGGIYIRLPAQSFDKKPEIGDDYNGVLIRGKIVAVDARYYVITLPENLITESED